MTVYDLAHELARNLTSTKEFQEFKKAREKLDRDQQAKKMLEDFRKKQFQVQAIKLSGKSADEEEKKLQNLYQIVSYNTTVNNYIEAETRFATLMSDIYNIIEKALGFESHEIEPDDNK